MRSRLKTWLFGAGFALAGGTFGVAGSDPASQLPAGELISGHSVIAYGEADPVCSHVRDFVDNSWSTAELAHYKWSSDPLRSISSISWVLQGSEAVVAHIDFNEDGIPDVLVKRPWSGHNSPFVGVFLTYELGPVEPDYVPEPSRDTVISVGPRYPLGRCLGSATCLSYAKSSFELRSATGVAKGRAPSIPADPFLEPAIDPALIQEPFLHRGKPYVLLRGMRHQNENLNPPDEWIAVSQIAYGGRRWWGFNDVCYIWSNPQRSSSPSQ
jgi:hypothetical protein